MLRTTTATDAKTAIRSLELSLEKSMNLLPPFPLRLGVAPDHCGRTAWRTLSQACRAS